MVRNIWKFSDQRTRVVLLANMRWKGMGQTNRQAWAQALTTQYKNVEVLYIETLGWHPIPQLAATIPDDRVRVLHAWNLIPRAGKPTQGLARKANSLLTYLQILLSARAFLRPDLLITFDPLSESLVRVLRPKSTLYDCLDLYAEQPQYSLSPVEQRSLQEAEQRLAAAVDRVSVSAQPLVARFAGTVKEPIYKAGAPMPLGVQPSRGRINGDNDSTKIRGLYIGALDDYKVDFSVFHSLLDMEPRLHLTLVGRAHHRSDRTDDNLARLRKRDRVKILEPMSRDALPRLLAESDFGVIAMRPGLYSDHSFPLKLWDYLEAGIPVLASGSLAMTAVRQGVVAVRDATCLTRPILDGVLGLRNDYKAIHEYAKRNSAMQRVAAILEGFDLRLD